MDYDPNNNFLRGLKNNSMTYNVFVQDLILVR